jgi:hypothetical protein
MFDIEVLDRTDKVMTEPLSRAMTIYTSNHVSNLSTDRPVRVDQEFFA